MGAWMNSLSKQRARSWIAGLLFALFPAQGMVVGQTANPVSADKPATAQASPGPASKGKAAAKPPTAGDSQRAAKLYLDSSKLYEKEKFEEAMQGFLEAAKLDPTSPNYRLAADVARSHAVTALIQSAAKDRFRGDVKAERLALTHALELDPRNIQVTEHLHEMEDDALRGQAASPFEQVASTLAEAAPFEHPAGVHSFHLHTSQRSEIQDVFKAYGLDATLDDSVRGMQLRLDLEDASFDQAMDVLSLLTHTFYVPLDTHRVLVALDTRPNRELFQRMELETIYLPGLAATELTEVSTLAKSVFELQQAAVDPSAGTITLRAPAATLNALIGMADSPVLSEAQIKLDTKVLGGQYDVLTARHLRFAPISVPPL